jgi:hypothetical protein
VVCVNHCTVLQSTYFNQAKVVISELQASNGVLYLVDEVLNLPEGTIDDIIMNPDYSINNFMDFIKEAKLTNVFNRTTGEQWRIQSFFKGGGGSTIKFGFQRGFPYYFWFSKWFILSKYVIFTLF